MKFGQVFQYSLRRLIVVIYIRMVLTDVWNQRPSDAPTVNETYRVVIGLDSLLLLNTHTHKFHEETEKTCANVHSLKGE